MARRTYRIWDASVAPTQFIALEQSDCMTLNHLRYGKIASIHIVPLGSLAAPDRPFERNSPDIFLYPSMHFHVYIVEGFDTHPQPSLSLA